MKAGASKTVNRHGETYPLCLFRFFPVLYDNMLTNRPIKRKLAKERD